MYIYIYIEYYIKNKKSFDQFDPDVSSVSVEKQFLRISSRDEKCIGFICIEQSGFSGCLLWFCVTKLDRKNGRKVLKSTLFTPFSLSPRSRSHTQSSCLWNLDQITFLLHLSNSIVYSLILSSFYIYAGILHSIYLRFGPFSYLLIFICTSIYIVLKLFFNKNSNLSSL